MIAPDFQADPFKPTGDDKPQRFTLRDASAMPLVQRSAYLVKNIIPTEGLIVVWGPPKCGKSFWVLDLAFHIALGWEYRGRRVKQGLALYVCCEGAFALPARIEAFRQAKIGGPIEPDCFKAILTRLDLVADADQMIADIAFQLGDTRPVIIIIDTLNRSLAGSESSDADMGAYIKAADRLRERFGCAVAVVHHCGYDATHPRGHTSLLGAADAQIAVKKDCSGLVTTEVEYLKDGPEGETTASRFKVVDPLAFDEDGDPISSCVLEPFGDDQKPAAKARDKTKPLPSTLQITLDALQLALDAHGVPAIGIPGYIKPGTIVVPERLWLCFYLAKTCKDGQSEDTRRHAYRDRRDKIIARKLAIMYNENVWIPISRE